MGYSTNCLIFGHKTVMRLDRMQMTTDTAIFMLHCMEGLETFIKYFSKIHSSQCRTIEQMIGHCQSFLTYIREEHDDNTGWLNYIVDYTENLGVKIHKLIKSKEEPNVSHDHVEFGSNSFEMCMLAMFYNEMNRHLVRENGNVYHSLKRQERGHVETLLIWFSDVPVRKVNFEDITFILSDLKSLKNITLPQVRNALGEMISRAHDEGDTTREDYFAYLMRIVSSFSP